MNLPRHLKARRRHSIPRNEAPENPYSEILAGITPEQAAAHDAAVSTLSVAAARKAAADMDRQPAFDPENERHCWNVARLEALRRRISSPTNP